MCFLIINYSFKMEEANDGFITFLYFQLHLHYIFLDILTQLTSSVANFYSVGAKAKI